MEAASIDGFEHLVVLDHDKEGHSEEPQKAESEWEHAQHAIVLIVAIFGHLFNDTAPVEPRFNACQFAILV